MLLRSAIAVLVIAALGLLGWRILGIGGSGRSGDDTTALTTPENSDYYMRDATIRQMNDGGNLAYRMTLGETLHYPDGSARLHDIHVHYLAGTPTYWDLEATRGRVPADSRDIYLSGGVTLRHPQPDGDIVVIRTDNAWIRTQADLIETRAHVTATAPGRIAEGDGLRIDLDTDRLKILDNVQVRYTPQASAQ